MRSFLVCTLLASGFVSAQGYFQSPPMHAATTRIINRTLAAETLPAPLVSFRKGTTQTKGAAVITNLSAQASSSSEWTKKRLHNTAAFRSLAILAALAIAGFSSKSQQVIPIQIMAVIHMLSFATWFGTVVYTTFVAGITMFQNLPRQTFGKLQAKLFPKYFSISSVALVLQLVTLKKLPALSATAAAHNNSARALAVALLMTVVNQFYLEPTSTNNMMERYELDDAGKGDTERYKKLKASFGKFHGMSSLANLIALCGGVAHAVYLGASLARTV